MKKTFVLDTNVLLHDQDAPVAFEDNDIAIPITVLEELDTFKTQQGELGRAARSVSRFLDSLRAKGALSRGVPLGFGLGSLSIIAEDIKFEFMHLASSADNYILGITRRLAQDAEVRNNGPVILVTKDVNLRVKADALGISAQDYENDRVANGKNAGQIKNIILDAEHIRRFYAEPSYFIDENQLPYDSSCPNDDTLYENACVVAKDPGGSTSVLLRVRGGALSRIKTFNQMGDIVPRNAEQRFLCDLLLDDRIDLVVVNGVAGSGKTLLSLAAGLQWVGTDKSRRMLITKVIEEVGNDIGFLPGTKEEKMQEWTKPFFDNLELLLDRDYLQMYLKNRMIEIDALTYIRGRSIMNRYIIIDETQNLAPKHIKTIVSRVADSSKLVLLGDITQIDNPYLDRQTCGLAYVLRKMAHTPGCGVLSMSKSERGRLAKLAVELL